MRFGLPRAPKASAWAGWSILDPRTVAALLQVPAEWKFIGYFCLGYPQLEDNVPELEQMGWEERRLLASVIIKR